MRYSLAPAPMTPRISSVKAIFIKLVQRRHEVIFSNVYEYTYSNK